MFAILGLRSLYQVIAQLVSDLPFMQKAVGLVLVYIGLKVVAESEWIGYKLNMDVSMAIVLLILGGGLVISLYKRQRQAPAESANEPKVQAV
jgi:predicted tellurium resistance membrane protein TerC